MSGKREDIPPSTTKADNTLKPDFTFNQMQQLWDDIESTFPRVEPQQPGDITTDMYRLHYQINSKIAAAQMAEIARTQPDKFTIVEVKAMNGKIVKVLRRK